MGEQNLIGDEAANLRETEEWFRNLPSVGGDIAQRSLAFLKEERQLFDRAMVLQAATVALVKRGGPIDDDGFRAAILCACYVFDMLLCGWNALIRGFHSVALHEVREIEQATITEVAVTLDEGIARKFWEGKLQDGEARKALEKAYKQEDESFGEQWGKNRKDIRNYLIDLNHPGLVATKHSIRIAPDGKSATVIIGGELIEEHSQWIARLYADLAFDGACRALQAFRNVIPDGGQLERRFEELAAWRTPFMHRWQKELG